MVWFTTPSFVVVLGFESETALVEYVKTNGHIHGAIIFVDADDLDKLPTKITYKIRLLSNETVWKYDRDRNSPLRRPRSIDFYQGERSCLISRIIDDN